MMVIATRERPTGIGEVQTQAQSYASPAPSTKEGLLERYKIKAKPSINDQVEPLFVNLWDNPAFKKLFDAIYDSEAVNGATRLDDYVAATMIRDAAIEQGNMDVGGQKLATIVKAMGVVVNRYDLNRTVRRNTLNGERVGGAGNDE